MDGCQVGEIRKVWVDINRLDPAAGRKRRPGVITAPGRRFGHWLVMGLTTLAAYGDGAPREPLMEWRLSGLRRPSYLWGRNLVVMSDGDVGTSIGRVARSDATTIVSMVGDAVTAEQAAALLEAAIELPEFIGDPFAGLPS